jgi:FAD/FMN-containing dehydrogenase
MHQRTFSFETTLSFETADGRVGTAVLTAGTSGWRIIEAVDEDGHALIVPPSVAAATAGGFDFRCGGGRR